MPRLGLVADLALVDRELAARPEAAALGPRADRRRLAGDGHQVLAALGHAQARVAAARWCTDDAAGSGCSVDAPSSTVAPAYIVMTRAHRNSTTARSCETRMRPIPSSSRSCRMSTRISYWTVTSSAVVGSSRTSSGGLQREGRGDHHPLAHAARELVRALVEDAVGARDLDHVEQPPGLGARLGLGQLAAAEMERLEQLGLDGQHRVEPGQRALRHVADGPARGSAARPSRRRGSGRGRRSSAGRPMTSDAVARQRPREAAAEHRLARARLADDARATRRAAARTSPSRRSAAVRRRASARSAGGRRRGTGRRGSTTIGSGSGSSPSTDRRRRRASATRRGP